MNEMPENISFHDPIIDEMLTYCDLGIGSHLVEIEDLLNELALKAIQTQELSPENKENIVEPQEQ